MNTLTLYSSPFTLYGKMKIDGRQIASLIKLTLAAKVRQLKKVSVIPHLAVIIVGSDPSSVSYVGQKKKIGEEIGIRVTIINNPLIRSGDSLEKVVSTLNADAKVHGIIIQRPIPLEIAKDALDLMVVPHKDVDGFHPKSQFVPPIALAVDKILRFVSDNSSQKRESYEKFLSSKTIVVIGRGETGGKPIADYLCSQNVPFSIIHSKTDKSDRINLLNNADVVISGVGKSGVFNAGELKKGSIVLGIGMHPENGKLKGDYNEAEISEVSSWYTPIPGGVGPVNVACLLENVVAAAARTVPIQRGN